MLHLYLKSIHIIGFISWFAGLFYLVRLFVYKIESIENEKGQELQEHLDLMTRRLLNIITIPAMTITWICGIAMLINNPIFFEYSWMHFKLLFLAILLWYQWKCVKISQSLSKNIIPFNSFRMRLFNELPTTLMVGIVFFAVLKNSLKASYGILGFILFGIVLFFAAWRYKSLRTKNKKN